MAIPKNGKKKSLLKPKKEIKVAELGAHDLRMMDNDKGFQKAIKELDINADAMNMSKYYNLFLDYKKGGVTGIKRYQGYGKP